MPDRYGPAYSSFPDPERAPSSAPSGRAAPRCPQTATCCRVPNVFEAAYVVRDLIIKNARTAGFDESACFGIQLALDEALANAIIHGNARSAETTVEITYDITPQAVYLSVKDEGDGFNPKNVDDPTSEKNLEVPAGRGLFLMRAYMTLVCYNSRGNCVTMIHERTPQTKTDQKAGTVEGHEKNSA